MRISVLVSRMKKRWSGESIRWISLIETSPLFEKLVFAHTDADRQTLAATVDYRMPPVPWQQIRHSFHFRKSDRVRPAILCVDQPEHFPKQMRRAYGKYNLVCRTDQAANDTARVGGVAHVHQEHGAALGDILKD